MKRLNMIAAIFFFFFFLFASSAPASAAQQAYLRPGQNPQSRAIADAGNEQNALNIAQSKGWEIFQLEQDTYLGNYGASGEFVRGIMPAGTWMGIGNGRVYVVGYTDAYGHWYGCGNLTDLTPPASRQVVQVPQQQQQQQQQQDIIVTVNNYAPTGPAAQGALPTGGQHSTTAGGGMFFTLQPTQGDINVGGNTFNVQGGTAISGSFSSANSQSQSQANTAISNVLVGAGGAGAGSANAAGSQTQNQ